MLRRNSGDGRLCVTSTATARGSGGNQSTQQGQQNHYESDSFLLHLGIPNPATHRCSQTSGLQL